MKGSKILFLFLFLVFAFLGSQQVTKANVFPFYIHVTQPDSETPFDGDFADGTGAAIRFMIQDTVITSDVTVLVKDGATTVKTLNLNGIKGGYHSVLWDGSSDGPGVVVAGSYTVEVTASQATGHAAYTLVFDCDGAAGLSTRGVTINNDPSSKSFGFAYGVTTPGGGSWNFTGIGRVAANGLLFGDTLGNAQVTSTGEGLGPTNRRYSPRIDSDGYIYVVGRDQKEILRFHVDTLNTTILVDTVATSGLINGIFVSGTGASKYLWIASTTGIFGAAIGESDHYTGAIDSLIPAPVGFQYWDVLKGDGDALYTVILKATAGAGEGVLKYNMPAPASKTVADTVWFAPVVGDAVALDIWRGATSASSDDILYLTFDQMVGSTSGVFKIDNLDGPPAVALAYQDLDENTTRTRGQVAVDYAGNLIYFENSNEQILVIAPPSGPNSMTMTALDPLVILEQLPVELNALSAKVVGKAINLIWSTATETNNRGFEIQRKAAGNDFVAVGFVQGKGTTTQLQRYSFVDNDVQAGTYQYRLKQIDLDGSYSISSIVEISITAPVEFSLAQNYPNPFNPSTTINFSLAKESNVNLKVFDLLGQEIISLVNNEFMTTGSYSYKFDASKLASGTYIYRLEAGDFVQTKKMTLTK